MSDDRNKLKLGKGSYFVKTRLRQLKQEDDTWETDFFPVPSPDARVGDMWLGLVLGHAHDNVLAQYTVQEPPGVNDLARLLADAMRRPLTPSAHRPRVLHLRNRVEWSELLPHLKQIGIEVEFRDVLPKWDEAFGERFPEYDAWLATEQAEKAAHWKRVKELDDDPAGLVLFALEKLAGKKLSDLPGVRPPVPAPPPVRPVIRPLPSATKPNVGRNDPCPCRTAKSSSTAA